MRVPKGARAGAAILVQCAEGETAAWPADLPRWTPPPAVAHATEANARRGAHQCPVCREVRRSLIATRDIQEGERILTPPGNEGNLTGPGIEANCMVTFDGGYRTEMGHT
eukprot:4874000-Lingulodinium_polyedra.AAC.1